MSFEITDWNLNPNLLWFVKLSDSGSSIDIELFSSQADAVASTNVEASGNVSYGSNGLVVLTSSESSDIEISFFTDDSTYHLKVSGENGDSTVILQISPFVDLDDITDSIYRSEDLISKRVIYEINLHTHSSNRKDILIANHKPTLQVGDICRINSSFRGIDVLTVLEDFTISGTQNSLTNDISTVNYTDINYE